MYLRGSRVLSQRMCGSVCVFFFSCQRYSHTAQRSVWSAPGFIGRRPRGNQINFVQRRRCSCQHHFKKWSWLRRDAKHFPIILIRRSGT